MNNTLYKRLAFSNLKKNVSTYVPYLITCICSVAAYYMIYAISLNEGIDQLSGGEQLKNVLFLGNYVIAIFSIVFLFYTNSFLIKRRKKELGLYCILGMEKRHITRVLIFESLYTAAASIVTGLFAGIVFSRVLFLLLLNILHFEVSLAFHISLVSVYKTIVLFTGIFLLTMLFNIWNIRTTNPIALLKGGNVGEKDPKTKPIVTIVGTLTLLTGYVLSLSVKSPLDALLLFFIAVILVIIGTYCLFTAGSIFVLKLLRKNKKFYYSKDNFISISGMLYRMKQNAIGLSNICILSTMVLVTLSTTFSLYVGKDDLLRTRLPKDIKVTIQGSSADCEKIEEIADSLSEKYHIQIQEETHFQNIYFGVVQQGDSFTINNDDNFNNKYMYVTVLNLDDYNRLEKKNITLNSNEVLFYSKNVNLGKSIVLEGTTYTVKERLEDLTIAQNSDSSLVTEFFLIVKDESVMQSLESYMGKDMDNTTDPYDISFNIKGDKQSLLSFSNDFINQIKQEISGVQHAESIYIWEETFYMFYGGFLFVGIFLGAMFMMATVLIIYYKQISEGYDDHDRFIIMQKVGLSKSEVKKTIRKQIKMVFLLPILVAVVHVCFAFPVINKLLMLFGLTNTPLFMLCTAGTILVFTIVYALVYNLTAGTYYNLVEV